VAILGIGAYLVIDAQITPGVMIAASIIMGRALAPVEMAVGNFRSFVLTRAAWDRLKMFMKSWRPRDDMPLPRPEGALSVERVVGVPPGSNKPVVKGITFSIGAGEALGIIGPSAAGKSTLARMLVGIWKPASGHVRLDGADVADWDHRQLGPYIGYLPQDVELFDGTVAENIARFTEPDPEAVIAAAQLAGVHDMILRFENGYDTRIGEAGAILSGGQRQRVGLARAVYKRPALVVLDEPNANLDGQGEEALKRALTALKEGGTTVILVAHRPSIVSVLDKLLVVRDGQVEEFGPLAEVLPKVTKPQGRGPQVVGGGARMTPAE
jgi:PrtD family type I secretion system ABC transporter